MVSTQDYHVCNSPVHKLSFISLCISISLPGLKHCVVKLFVKGEGLWMHEYLACLCSVNKPALNESQQYSAFKHGN